MNRITGISTNLRHYFRGQSGLDFTAILLAVAVTVFVGYETLGGKIH
jgi:hypothetical protein